jgi:hypothetical protein
MDNQNGNQQNVPPVTIDSKTFYEKNIDHRTGVIVIAIIILVLGLLGFFQICSIQAGWCDGCGCAASSQEMSGDDDGAIDPSCVALWEFFVVILIIIGSAMLFYYWSLLNSSKKLIASGNMYGAAEINASKDAVATDALLGQQTKMYMDKYKAQTKQSVTTLDPTILAECDVCDDSSTDSSDSSSDSD